MIYLIIEELSKLGTTNLIITNESNSSDGGLKTTDGVSEYACDGIIRLGMAAVGETLNRTIEVPKMRRTKIDGIKHSFDFDPQAGIVLE
jgi:KaiC/GvpD/RAD55 family RecA-like ATPase